MFHAINVYIYIYIYIVARSSIGLLCGSYVPRRQYLCVSSYHMMIGDRWWLIRRKSEGSSRGLFDVLSWADWGKPLNTCSDRRCRPPSYSHPPAPATLNTTQKPLLLAQCVQCVEILLILLYIINSYFSCCHVVQRTYYHVVIGLL